MKNIKKIQQAFTIIEVVVAITVFAIGVIGIATFFANSARFTRSASDISVASNLASGLIEEELNQSYDTLEVKDGPKTPFADPFGNYKNQINISYVNGMTLDHSETETDLKKIEVFVYYQEAGTEKNVKTSTLKTRR